MQRSQGKNSLCSMRSLWLELICRLCRDQGSVMAALRYRGEAAYDLVPTLAAVLAGQYFPRCRCGKNRERLSRFFETEGFNTGLHSVRQPIVQNFPASPPIRTARDSRTGKMGRAPGAGSIVRSGHKNRLWV